MQELTAKFVTIPETGEYMFIFQPIIHNKNLMYRKFVRKNKRMVMVTFQQVDFKIPSSINMTVNEVFNQESFIMYEEFCKKLCYIHKNGYLQLKFHLVSIFKLPGKYPPPIIITVVKEWNIESMVKLFNTRGKGPKSSEG